MRAKPLLFVLGTCLAADGGGGNRRPSWFEAHTSGAMVLTLRGSARVRSGRGRCRAPARSS